MVSAARTDYCGAGDRCSGGTRSAIRILAVAGVRGDFAEQCGVVGWHLARERIDPGRKGRAAAEPNSGSGDKSLKKLPSRG